MFLPNVLAASSIVEVRPGLIFWTLVTFILVAIILRWKAWGPILAVVEEREKQITSSIEAAKRERAEAEKLLAEHNKATAQGKARTVDRAVEVAGKLLSERLDDSKHRALAEQFVKDLPAKGGAERRS